MREVSAERSAKVVKALMAKQRTAMELRAELRMPENNRSLLTIGSILKALKAEGLADVVGIRDTGKPGPAPFVWGWKA